MMAAWDPEHQAPYLTEVEAIQLPIDPSELSQLTEWNGLGFQLRESPLVKRTPVTPPVTSERELTPARLLLPPWCGVCGQRRQRRLPFLILLHLLH
jgi:hypothetical protein